jgi:hypothetical protein
VSSATHDTGACGTALPSGPGANTSLDMTRPSTPVTSRTLLTKRRSRPPLAYSLRLVWKTTKSIAPAISMCVASIGSRSVAWIAYVAIRLNTSSEEFAWIVDREPSLP